MVTSTAQSPEEYLADLPPDRREAIAAVRDVIRQNLPAGARLIARDACEEGRLRN